MARGARKKKLLRLNPFCIYCGGEVSSTSWDHMPNKGMFPKDRVEGLEFPSCDACNQGSKWFEDVAAFVGSIQWGADGQWVDEHFESKLKHLVDQHPEIVDELQPSMRQLREAKKVHDVEGEPLGVLNLQGALVSQAMLLYGAKLALALHWNETGQILGPDGKIGVIWWSNDSAIKREVPQALFELLPERKSLQQGLKTSRYLFEYGSGRATDTDATAHWAVFSNAFIFYLFFGRTISVEALPSSNVLSPGCLQITKSDALNVPGKWKVGPFRYSALYP